MAFVPSQEGRISCCFTIIISWHQDIAFLRGAGEKKFSPNGRRGRHLIPREEEEWRGIPAAAQAEAGVWERNAVKLIDMVGRSVLGAHTAACGVMRDGRQ